MCSFLLGVLGWLQYRWLVEQKQRSTERVGGHSAGQVQREARVGSLYGD